MTAFSAGVDGRERSIEDELFGAGFSDLRLRRRLEAVVRGLEERMGRSIPWAFQDWAAVKAAYRFLSNQRVSEAEILAGHMLATRSRLPKGNSPVLMLHDTTEFSYRRKLCLICPKIFLRMDL